MELINLLILIFTFAIFALAPLLGYAEALAKVDEKFVERKLRLVILSLFAIFTAVIFLSAYSMLSSSKDLFTTTLVAFIILIYILVGAVLFIRYFSLKKEYGYIKKESLKTFLIFFILINLGSFIFIFAGVYGIYNTLRTSEALSFTFIIEFLGSIFLLVVGIAIYIVVVSGLYTGYAKKEKGKEIRNENRV